MRQALAFALCWSLFFVPGCDGGRRASSSGQHQITLAGSTSVEPFAELLAERYMHEHPGAVAINVQGGGSSAGVRAALLGAADIGMSSRNLKPAEQQEGLVTQLIARDAIALIVHPSNDIQDLTLAQVRDIFAGRIMTWREVGGLDQPITVVTREEGSGTRGAFEELLMEGASITPRALRQDSNGAVRVIVAGDPNAVGYISLGLVDRRVKAVRLDGVVASTQNVRKDSYRLSRPFLFMWHGELSAAARAFLDYVLSDEGQGLLVREGLVAGGG